MGRIMRNCLDRAVVYKAFQLEIDQIQKQMKQIIVPMVTRTMMFQRETKELDTGQHGENRSEMETADTHTGEKRPQ